ncbi:hypothetical protein HO173_003398 [Letharia columbiana]|uniref:Uncharacterized protein n=1 Tax=Letharia columbiana TaxID=112416 RepID=A0A8H6G0T7_9LECA|nr:uncharacterized protein HO173_003398 [Letharia columbiana]KAF6238431.1 hypothetical protein HO173_003398 [Letharia columbiana]
MGSNIQASLLHTLPLELRTKIYKELLSPDPARVYTLYHDRHGREASFNIDPTILRVNKQIYSEAISVLYDTISVRIHLATPVVRQCTLGTYPDRLVDPPSLFREDTEATVESANKLSRRSRNRSLEFEALFGSMAQGYIYPHCFQRLRKIHLVTSRHAIWGATRGGSYFSHAGKLVLRILRLLANEQDSNAPMIKHFRLTYQPSWRTFESQMLLGDGEMDKRTKAIVGLLKALKRRTDAEIVVEEGALTKTLGELEMELLDDTDDEL